MLKNSPINQMLQQMPSVIPNYCDKCGAKHAKEDAEVVSQEHDKVSIRLTCTNCNSIYMIQVQSPADGVLAARKVVTKSDITADEMKKFGDSQTIDPEEILDVVLALEKVNNIKDFSLLFASSEESNTRVSF